MNILELRKKDREVSFSETLSKDSVEKCGEFEEKFTLHESVILDEKGNKSGKIIYKIFSAPCKYIHLSTFYVTPKGVGLGKAVVDNILQLARDNNCPLTLKDDTLNSVNNNYDGVKDFYKKLGFRSMFSANDHEGKMKVFGELDHSFDQYFLDKFAEEDTEDFSDTFPKYARMKI